MSDPFDPDATVPLVRPFLERKRPLKPVSPDEHPHAPSHSVRAYAITGGRAHAAAPLEFETMLQTTGAGREAYTAQKFERADILSHCQTDDLSAV